MLIYFYVHAGLDPVVHGVQLVHDHVIAHKRASSLHDLKGSGKLVVAGEVYSEHHSEILRDEFCQDGGYGAHSLELTNLIGEFDRQRRLT